MMCLKLKVMTVLVAAAGLVGTAAPDGQAEQKAKSEVGPQFPATVKTVNTAKGTVTVAVMTNQAKKELTEKTFDLARDAKVILTDARSKTDPGKEGKLTDLAEGTSITVQLAADQKTVTRITVGPASIHAAVKGVDAARKALTVTVKTSKGQQEKTLVLAKEARVLLNDGLSKGAKDKEGNLAELAEGTPVVVLVSALDQKTVLAIRVQHQSLHGTIKGVDLGNQTITVTVKENAQIVDRTLRVATNAHLETKLADLNVGTPVRVDLSVFDNATATAVRLPPKNDDQ